MTEAGASPLHLVRTAFDEVALRIFAAHHKVNDDDLGYALHLALRWRYGAAAPQPFRRMPLRPGRQTGGGVLLGYTTDAASLLASDPNAGGSRQDPSLPDWTGDWDREDELARVFPGPIEAKPMPQVWREGQRLGFEVRARPVRRHGPKVRAARAAAGKQATGTEHDAFLSTVEALEPGTHDHTRASVYAEWLAERLARAASVDKAVLRSFRRTRVCRARGPKGQREPGPLVEGPDALMAGTLRITDPAAFAGLLARGVGRHVAFGFGMLLLRPAGPAAA